MNEAQIFTYLYPVVPLIGLMGFMPQIIRLVKLEQTPDAISLSTWLIWTTTWLISFGYAVYTLQDLMFAITSGMNLVGHILIIMLTVYKRQKYAAEIPLTSFVKA